MNANYCLLDAACMQGEIEKAQLLNGEYDSLYRGKSKQELSQVAPYIFKYQNETPFSEWLFAEGWGCSWGIFFYSELEMEELCRHFRQFLLVQTEQGEELYFRFYDPRVLRIFLPTCDKLQLQQFFGPIDYFVLEAEDAGQAIVFSLKEGLLHTEKKPAGVLPALKSQTSD